jgi:hypothetical protein
LSNSIRFNSSFSSLFYLAILFLAGVLIFSVGSFINNKLDIPGLVFINALSLLIACYFSLGVECRISITTDVLRMNYILPLKRSIHIITDQIIGFEKLPEASRPHCKRVVIKTNKKEYVIKYAISDTSDEKFYIILQQLVTQNRSGYKE